MKILWLINIMLPKIADSLSEPTSNSGGWLTGLSNDLLQQNDIELSVCFPLSNKNKVVHDNINNLKYYGFPKSKMKDTRYNPELEKYFEYIIKDAKPDIVHIFGTEYSHALAMVNTCEKLGIINKVVVNIQGLVSVYQNHFYANLPHKVIHRYTFRDLIKQNNIKQQRDNFIKRGKFEIDALRKVKHIIGRTDWDKACTSQINPYANYYFCNETLRDEFYKHSWNLNDCLKHSIFISQAGYPIKGFHFMLEAMPEILKRYPDAHIYVTGKNPLDSKSILDKAKQTYYQKYIGMQINRLGLERNVTFLGNLNEREMCNRFLKSNVFVLPSSIENSPNSLGEAMLLGIPSVTADVGGVKNLIKHEEEGYVYQYDAPYMLAYYVMEIFNSDDLANTFSKRQREHAFKTHNREKNLKRVLDIYAKIDNFK